MLDADRSRRPDAACSVGRGSRTSWSAREQHRSTCRCGSGPASAGRRRTGGRAGTDAADALATALAQGSGPTIAVLKAGNIHSGDFDPFAACVAIAREHGAWVHVDGAFWAAVLAALGRRRARVGGRPTRGPPILHKTLSVPYDCGLAIVRDRRTPLASSMAMHGDYLIEATGDPHEYRAGPEEAPRVAPAGVRRLGGRASLRVDGVVRTRRGSRDPCPRGLRRGRDGDPWRRGAQRRGLHPRSCLYVRRRRPDAPSPPPSSPTALTWMTGYALARPRDRPDLGEQLEYHRRRRTTIPDSTPCAGPRRSDRRLRVECWIGSGEGGKHQHTTVMVEPDEPAAFNHEWGAVA